MCNRTDCYGSAFGEMACSVCRERDMSEEEPCAICGDTETDTIQLHYSGDPWERDAPYNVALCREHQRALIDPVQEGVK